MSYYFRYLHQELLIQNKMKDFLDYDIKYPDLIRKLIVFFSKNETKKTIMDFCNSFKVSEGSEKIQPDIVGRICERLCNMRKLICIQREGFGYTNFSYYATPLDSNNNDILTHYFNSCVYGLNIFIAVTKSEQFQ